MAAGNAIFASEARGTVIGQPLEVAIPQYAWLTDAKTKDRQPVIVVQAEEANGIKIVGYRTVTGGQNGAALLSEFELLGTTVPRSAE